MKQEAVKMHQHESFTLQSTGPQGNMLIMLLVFSFDLLMDFILDILHRASSVFSLIKTQTVRFLENQTSTTSLSSYGFSNSTHTTNHNPYYPSNTVAFSVTRPCPQNLAHQIPHRASFLHPAIKLHSMLLRLPSPATKTVLGTTAIFESIDQSMQVEINHVYIYTLY